ncbi:MAG: hypothetical protein D6775_08440 [Caldilineae bacterium]|nr:MAG: hypothetical protein D6775_08440 [Caldilineae bacterium]
MSLHSLYELTGDFVIYRNLEPYDTRVPGLQQAWSAMGLPDNTVVRKRDPLYPQAATWLLQQIHAIHAPHTRPCELLLIGDTEGNDGAAFWRLKTHTGWAGTAFIGSEKPHEAASAVWKDEIFVTNRWQGIARWLCELEERNLAIDERTIAIVDIDKTALGARGRNHRPIDAARLSALTATVTQALGPDADLEEFARIYHELNQSTYHDLTGDNQDYLAYICIMVGAGLIPLNELKARHDEGRLNAFVDFISSVEAQAEKLSRPLMTVHRAVYESYRAGDPTPFKDFRRNEFRATVAAMGHLPDDVSETLRAQEEICLTREVWDACRWLQERGVLIAALSDKPDEACAPDPAESDPTLRPIHRTPTHLLGQALSI